MKRTVLIYLLLMTWCALTTAWWLSAGQFSSETAHWSIPAFFAYLSQLIFSAVLVRNGRSSLIMNLLKSFLALLISAAIMATFSCLLWVYRLEVPGVDYVGAFVDYLFTIPG